MTFQSHEHRFPASASLVQALVGEIRSRLHEALSTRTHASLVVSGGRTPIELFQALRKEDLDWSKVWITLADERWVETSSEQSNERLVRTHLLQEKAAKAHLVGLKNPAPTAEAGAEWAWRALSRVPRPYDVLVLGMGDDGHTASLFPGSMGLARALDLTQPSGCVAMNALTAPHSRVSLNLAALLEARWVALHIQGETKWQMYERARKSGAANELPIRAILHQKQVPVDVYWSP